MRAARCSYCGRRGKAVSLGALAYIVAGPLEEHCQHGGFSPHFSLDSDKPDYEQEGESLNWLLQEELGVDEPCAADLAAVLIANDPNDPRDGGEPFFADDQNYQRAEVHPWEYIESWNVFASRVKHERRFFDGVAQAQLENILGGQGTARAAELPVTEIGPGRPIHRLFRARRAETREKAKQILGNPSAELGPPGAIHSRAGRMNPAGIAVFYGAVSQLTAIAEVRPPVGGVAIVGSFSPLRLMRLLDLTRMGDGFTGSLFSPEYEDRAARLQFLRGFHSLIGRPVQPHEETIEYIPTQVVAEYVANVLGFDGILYASSQIGTQEDDYEVDEQTAAGLSDCNVVLFGAATVVAGSSHTSKVGAYKEALVYDSNSAQAMKTIQVSYSVGRDYSWEDANGTLPGPPEVDELF